MKNNFLKSILITFFCFYVFDAYSQDQFNFDITEIQIKENGNTFIGKKRGTITSSDGVIIKADEFEIPNYEDFIHLVKYNFNLQQLKTISRHYNQKVSGNKKQLIFNLYNFLKYS